MQLDGFEEVSSILSAGVYALVRRGVVIYVGKSKQVLARVYSHRNVAKRAAQGQVIPTWMPMKGFVFDQVFVRPCRVEDLDRLEIEMINRYKPRYNLSLKTRAPVEAFAVSVNGQAFMIKARPELNLRRL